MIDSRRAELVERLLAARKVAQERPGSTLRAPEPGERGPGPWPLSPAQERLWFLDRMAPATSAWNSSVAVALAGRLVPAALVAALGAVVSRHEALRTALVETPEGPRQRLTGRPRPRLPVIDLSGLPTALVEAEGRRLVRREAREPFDLAAPADGTLLRARLVRRRAAAGRDRHLALLTLHHAVSDAWSLGVLLGDLGTAYGQALGGSVPALPPPQLQMADWAVWQRRRLESGALDASLDRLAERLAGAPEPMALPLDRPRGGRRSGAGAGRVAVTLEAGERLDRLAREAGTSPFTALLAAFAATLAESGAGTDLVVGTPVANRDRPGLEETVGLLVNLVPLRLDCSGVARFDQLLDRARQTAAATFDHRDAPFERLVERLAPMRSPAHEPLVQVLLVLQNATEETLSLPGVTALPLEEGETGGAKVDLSLRLAPAGGSYRGSLVFRRDLFDPTTALRLARRFEAVVAAVAVRPALPWTELPVLASGERHQVLAEWSGGERPGPPGLVERLRALAATQGAAPAVCAPGLTLSFAELLERAEALAEELAALGVGPESRVALLLSREPALPVACLGTLLAGGAWVAVAPGEAPERRRRLLERLRPAAAVVGPGVAAGARDVPCPVLELDPAAPPVRERRRGAKAPRVPAEAAAYLVATSGSTGEAKLVEVSRAALDRFVAYLAEELGPWLGGPGLPLVASPTFDGMLKQLWGPLVAGRPVVVPERPEELAPGQLLAALGGGGALSLVPSVWRTVLDALERGELPPPERPGVLVLAGEELPSELALRTRRLLPGVGLTNLYGPSEAVGNQTWERRVDPNRPTLGRPVPGVRLHLLDRRLRPVPVGVAGELVVGGEGLARGYRGAPSRTAAAFVPDPFAERPGARLYRTGDRCRWTADGRVEFLGRIDRQIQLRGVRIEPGEVEAALVEHPRVAAAAVDPRPAGPGGEPVLVAWVVGRGGGAPDAARLRTHLAERLPAPAVPTLVVELEALPTTASGKVDRRRLALPASGAAVPAEAAPAPLEGEIARRLADLWGELLGLDREAAARLHGESDFFSLGGHSLLATRLVARLRSALGVELPLAALFEAPTLGRLARRVEALVAEPGASTPGPIFPEPIPTAPADAVAPLASAQRRIWFLEELGGLGAAYHMGSVLEIRGRLDRSALARAVSRVVARHGSLRTVYEAGDGEPLQRALPAGAALPGGALMPVVDLRPLPPAAREREERRLATSEIRRPFDLVCGPVLRLRLVALGPDEHLLILVVHHIASDGWSTGLLVDEVAGAYGALAHGDGGGGSPPLALQYTDYARWQRRRLDGGALDGEIDWWRRRLERLPPVALPADRPRRTRAVGARAVAVPLELAPVRVEAVRAFARRFGVTVFTVLLAAFETLLHRSGAEDDLPVGSPVSGRTRAELEALIGLFANLLVLRGDLSGDPPFAELVERTGRTVVEAQARQEVPFERLVASAGTPRDPLDAPLVQVVFAFQRRARALPRLPGCSVRPRTADPGAVKFDLTLTLVETDDGASGRIAGDLEASADTFDRVTVERWAERYDRLLAAALETPETRLWDLAWTSAAERAHLVAWSLPARPASAGATLIDLFDRSVARWPDAPALVDGDLTLSYRELARRVHDLAARLADHGVGPEVLVAVSMGRSADLVVALLAVLAAGGAYVPVDPGYPAERIELLLEDSGASLLLADPPETARPDEGPDIVRRAPVPPGRRGRRLEPDHLAYVLYTSGSTGRPKGVGITHRAVARLLEAAAGPCELDGGTADVWALFHSVSFDFSVWEIWGALAFGGRLVIVAQEVTRNPDAFLDLLVSERVTVLNQTPSAFYALAERVLERAPLALALRLVVFGGEPLEPRRLASWVERFGADRPRLVNMYGITETTVHVTVHPLPRVLWRPPVAESSGTPIGRPLFDLGVGVLDRRLRPAPAGIAGELAVSGPGLARGYHGRPGLTAERFVPDPASRQLGGRLYLSGDAGRYLDDGTLEHLGRMDGQVKVRGFRIEPGEVEAALEAHPGVDRAVVLVHDDAPGGRGLVGWWTAAGKDPPLVGELRAFVSARLPVHMVPAALVAVPSFPLTPHGKLDRRALPPPGTDRPALERPFEPPRTTTEEALAAAWGEVLGIGRIGRHDSFFALGGDSISALRVRAAAARRGVSFALADLFGHPTVAALADRVDDGTLIDPSKGASVEVVEPFSLLAPDIRQQLDLGLLDDALPATSLQAGMLFEAARSAGRGLYHDVLSFRLEGVFRPDALATALALVVSRHRALRTRFDLGGFDEPLQLVERRASTIPATVDLTRLARVDRDRALERYVSEELSHPFPIDRAPLLRLAVHQLERRGTGEALFQVSLCLHHAILDGWSVSLLLAELFRDYLDLAANREPRTEPPVEGMARFVAAERVARDNAASREHFRRLFSRIPAEAPASRGAVRRADAPPFERRRVLPPAVRRGLEAAAAQASLPVRALWLAVHLAACDRLDGGTGALTGVVTHGRSEDEEGDRALGLFLNSLPLGLSAGTIADASWIGLARRAFAAEAELATHRRFPLAQVEALARDHGRRRAFDVLFNVVRFRALDGLASLPELRLVSGRSVGRTELSLVVDFAVSPDGATVELVVKGGGSRPVSELLRFAHWLERGLERAAAAPWTPATILLSPAERHQVLLEWSQGPPLPGGGRELVSQRIERVLHSSAGDRVAAVDARGTLSRDSLLRAAGALTVQLMDLGVGPEVPVGLLIEPGRELTVALIAVLWAGGAWVPLDPSDPPGRLEALVSALEIPVVLVASGQADGRSGGSGRPVALPVDLEPPTARIGCSPPRFARPEPEQLAYILHTSGTTGRPKPVAVSHGSLAWYLDALEASPMGGLTRNLPAVSRPTFDAIWKQILGPLVRGEPIYWTAPERLAGVLASGTYRRVNCAPALFEAVLDQLDASRTRPRLDGILLGGEAVPPALLERARALMPEAEIWNLYGPTEATANATIVRLEAPAPVTIGRPLPGARALVLDHAGRPTLPGAPGELLLGGPGVARGYPGRAAATAERFVPDPHAGRHGSSPGARLYTTGDRARLTPDGRIELLGRTDRQVQLRGLRIEPGEIEAVLATHPDIRRAVVRLDEQGNEPALVAYLEKAAHAVRAPDSTELLTHASSLLPPALVPSSVVLVERLPRTAHGKVDHARLAQLAATRRSDLPTLEPLSSESDLELEVAALFGEILGRPVGPKDDLFALGGSSLAALRLVGRLGARFGVDLGLIELLDAPRPDRVADRIGALVASDFSRVLDGGSPLVTLRAGEGRPWILVHGGDGGITLFAPLARQLPGRRPVLGARSPWLHRGRPEVGGARELAAVYADSIVEVPGSTERPTLVGYSTGGAIAFELVRELANRGRSADLVLLDPTIPRSGPDDPWSLLIGFAGHILATPPRDLWDVLALSPDRLARLDRAEQMEILAREALGRGRLRGYDPGTATGELERRLALWQLHARAARHHVPEPIRGRSLLVAPPQRLAAQEERWRPAVDRLDLASTRGGHRSMMQDEHAVELARVLAVWVSRTPP